MTTSPVDPADRVDRVDPADATLTELRGLVVAATQRLLGDTIVVTDEDWSGPSRLPGWTRAHVATHLARQADGVVRLADGAATGERAQMYVSQDARDADIEAGAGRTGLELQTDLDTSAERLAEASERLDHLDAPDRGWDADVEMRGPLVVSARVLPLGRLFEVVIHHVDLDIGYEIDQVDPDVAAWLIEWVALRARANPAFPALELHADSGVTTSLGSTGEPVVVSGTAPALLGWLTHRGDASGLGGTEGIDLPGL